MAATLFSAAIYIILFQAAIGAVKMGDFTFQTPASLGRPQKGLLVEDAVSVDLTSIGLDCIETNQVSWIDNIGISTQATAMQAIYTGEDRQAHLTAIEFDNLSDASEFFSLWSDVVSEGAQIAHLEINLPTLPDQGSIQRGYNPRLGKAYNAWQYQRWVIIIEVPGPFSQASPLAQRVKQLVSQSYTGNQ
jgi:hypothetical protein